ncbi:DUF1345 domain-containing protein [Hydrogenophaga sp. RWCD_12]|uniref:DUF1345 domain-containing protein n=1 Tax=Hydrogenophaga sp. RWCD_12 TaxID=3391190 RepID=UPI003984D05C
MSTHPLHGLHWSARFSALQRQLVALVPGLMVGLGTSGLAGAPASTALLCGWVTYCVVYLALIGHLVHRLNATDTQRRARWEDPGAAMLFVLVTLAAVASLGAVTMAVDAGRHLQGLSRLAHLALVVASLMGAWLLIQSVFGLHYARRYYRPLDHHGGAAGGLSFPGDEAPDYLDFFYFSAVIGMTSQVSDVAIHDRAMRRLALWHGLLSFFFNLTVLALAVNVLASTLG